VLIVVIIWVVMKFNTPVPGKDEINKQTYKAVLKPTTTADSTQQVIQAPSTDNAVSKVDQTPANVRLSKNYSHYVHNLHV